ncbi:hypothetical protein OKW46_006705 [Paraburkholderia sp. WSM4179]|nr:hypothetical protein [Paraburkholderia sp. WSM4179]
MRRSSDIWGRTRNTSSGRDWLRVPFSSFLGNLRNRGDDPNEILNEQADAAEHEIRNFRTVRDASRESLVTVV